MFLGGVFGDGAVRITTEDTLLKRFNGGERNNDPLEREQANEERVKKKKKCKPFFNIQQLLFSMVIRLFVR